MQTIDVETSVKCEPLLTMTAALKLLQIKLNVNTATEYRKWLGLEEGEYFDRANTLRLHAMWWWCSQGSGRAYFSKRKFIELERSVLPDGRTQIEVELRKRAYVKPDF